MFIADRALISFYSSVFETSVPAKVGGPLTRHIEVEDVEATLARVWDLGGTIVSTDDVLGLGSVPRAAVFRDPAGNLVSIVWGQSKDSDPM